MSDMSRPYPLPTAPDHGLHDPLLVAQYAAGDPLDPGDHGKAELWANTCGACASLAADLRAVSGAVAWEPTPPRRRDFTLDPEQADRLRGNVFTRLLRRLALPQARRLRPAAAGGMSIGLLLVVASTAWPGDELVVPTSAPASAPAGQVLPLVASPPPAEPDVQREGEPGAGRAVLPNDDASEPEALRSQRDLSDAVDEPEAAFESEAQRSTLPEAAELAPDAAAPDGADELGAGLTESAGTEARDAGPASQLAGGAASDQEAAAAAKTVDVDAVPAVDVKGDGGIDVATALLALGVALTVGGATLLVLTWWARRRTDPLQP
jgi:hypothetical protein